MRKLILVFAFAMALVGCKKEETTETTGTTPTGAPSTVNLPTEFESLEGIFDENGIGAAVNLSKEVILFINQDGDQYAWYEGGEIKVVLDLDDANSIFRDSPLETVGAACMTSTSRIYIYNEEGENYTFANLQESDIEGEWDNEDLFEWSTGSSETWQWGPDNTIPFNRVSAMWTSTEMNGDCFDAEINYDDMWMADGNGDEIVMWGISDFDWQGDPVDTDEFVVENNCNGMDGILPFDKISAVCRIEKPNLIQEMYFNEDGTKFTIQTVSEGIFTEIYSLY